MRNLKGKRALVTGAASGIGRALALKLAGQGVELFLIDRDSHGLWETVSLCRLHGVVAHGSVCDLLDDGDLQHAVKHMLHVFENRLDILVNNAGVLYYGPTHRMTDDDWRRVMGVNLTAPLRLIQLLLPTLLAQPESHLVNVSSMFGLVGFSRMAAYHASKFALVGLGESLRSEYGPQGMGVTTMCPGFVDSGLIPSGVCGYTRRSVPQPPGWLTTTPELVADRTVSAIRRNRGLVVVTPLARLMWALERLAPGFLGWLQQCGRKKRVLTDLPTRPIAAEPATTLRSEPQRSEPQRTGLWANSSPRPQYSPAKL